MHISAHEFHPKIGREQCERRWSRMVERLGADIFTNPGIAAGFGHTAINDAPLAVYLGDQPKACSLLRWGAHFTDVLCRLGRVPKGEPIDVPHPDGRVIHATGTGKVDVVEWWNGLACAVIVRDWKIVEELCDVPIDLLRRPEPGVQTPEYMYLMAEGLQAVFREEDDAPDKVMAAIEATDGKVFNPEWAEHLDAPFLVALLRWMIDGPEAFDEAFKDALLEHKTYWSTIADLGLVDHRGMVPLHLIMLAAIAHDAGHALPFTSDYLPTFLVRGECAKAPSEEGRR